MAKHPGFLPGNVPFAHTPTDINLHCNYRFNLFFILDLVLNKQEINVLPIRLPL